MSLCLERTAVTIGLYVVLLVASFRIPIHATNSAGGAESRERFHSVIRSRLQTPPQFECSSL